MVHTIRKLSLYGQFRRCRGDHSAAERGRFRVEGRARQGGAKVKLLLERVCRELEGEPDSEAKALADARVELGNVLPFDGQQDRAEGRYLEALPLHRQIGARRGQAKVLQRAAMWRGCKLATTPPRGCTSKRCPTAKSETGWGRPDASLAWANWPAPGTQTLNWRFRYSSKRHGPSPQPATSSGPAVHPEPQPTLLPQVLPNGRKGKLS